ncbi:MAG TPA: carboxymuconolactone decarboxylase family protein [Chloroflexota bacterium]
MAQSEMYQRGAEVLRAIGGQPMDGPKRWPALPPDQAEDIARKLTEFCFGDTWGRPGSHLDLKTRRLITIAATAAMGRERQLRGHVAGALGQGISEGEIVETLVHLIAYCGFPAGLTAIDIANEVFAERKEGRA